MLPNVEATFTGVRAAVIISLVAALFAGLNYLLLSQGWLQSTLSFEVSKQWYACAQRFDLACILCFICLKFFLNFRDAVS